MHLIYTISIGERHQYLCNFMVESLRKNGEYTGEIILFTDDTVGFSKIEEAFNVQVIKINLIENIEAASLRLFVDDLIDVEKYDQIIYLDCDILAFKPIEPLFCANNNLIYAEEYGFVAKSFEIFALSFFDEEERIIWRKSPGINSGQFCVDAKIFRKVCEIWRSMLLSKEKRQWYDDQPAFNTIIRRKYIEAVPYEKRLVSFSFNNQPNYIEGIIHHYVGWYKKDMEYDFRKHINSNKHGICAYKNSANNYHHSNINIGNCYILNDMIFGDYELLGYIFQKKGNEFIVRWIHYGIEIYTIKEARLIISDTNCFRKV